MRTTFAHDAVITMNPADDIGAPGAAITVALCGHHRHEGPCPLAPHHTAAHRDGEEVRLRILFATEPEAEPVVRQRIDAALSATWPVRNSAVSDVRPDERAHANRLAESA